jgi:hypothetical protein
MTYHFHSLSDQPRRGVLDTPDGPNVAEFLSPEQAKALVLQEFRREELELLKRLRREIKYASDLA